MEEELQFNARNFFSGIPEAYGGEEENGLLTLIKSAARRLWSANNIIYNNLER